MVMLEDNRITYFGETNHRNKRTRFGIRHKDRRQHFYIIGKSGTGKTVLLNNLAVQDIRNGAGLCVVDPHGEFVEGLLAQIPKHRLGDVVYINPADAEFHTGFNVLELDDPEKKHLIASGLMGIFTKIWANVWSARMEYIMNNCVLALLDTPGSTLLGIPRLLVDKNYRQRIVANIKDPVVLTFWVNEYENWQDKFRSEAIAPIQNKVGQFLSTSLVRNIVGQKKSTINLYDMMNERKIILLNVSKGRIGEDNSDLLGSMFITKIQLSAMERVRIPENQREDFYLYVDEFQNFATDSFADILSEARKYRLDLIIAHQYVGQLVEDGSTKVRDAVFGNAGTMIIFRVGADDAEFLEKETEPDFMAHDMVNLPNYEVYARLMIEGVTSRPFSAYTLAPIKTEGDVCTAAEIIDAAHKRYCRPRAVVEKEINEWSGMAMADMGSTQTYEPTATSQSGSSGSETSAPKPVQTVVAGPNKNHGMADLAALGIEFAPEPGQGLPTPRTAGVGTPTSAQPSVGAESLMSRMARASTQFDTIKDIKKKIQKAGASSELANALRLEVEPDEPVIPEAAKPMTLKKLEEKGESNLSELQKTIKNVLEKDVLKKMETAPAPKPVFVPPPMPKPVPTPPPMPTPPKPIFTTSVPSPQPVVPKLAFVAPPTPPPAPVPKPFVPPTPPITPIAPKPAFVPLTISSVPVAAPQPASTPAAAVPPPVSKPVFTPPSMPVPPKPVAPPAPLAVPNPITLPAQPVVIVPSPTPAPVPAPVITPKPAAPLPTLAPSGVGTPSPAKPDVAAVQTPPPAVVSEPVPAAPSRGEIPKAPVTSAPTPAKAVVGAPTPETSGRGVGVTREIPEELLRRMVQVTEEDKRKRFPTSK